ncbi:sugar MFS transporter [Mucilaginibacter phyllosphaerae]|uniref:Glucose/galactose MFS transporter n=1 Tax=Mucilaginibacter phyllosphaerae TaxID=1812349 RepID=A0A4Y8AG90_9SPHI|nr:sugar MFS transporter [Mucilaginibacter phyllosphaerae]MBB3968597.1 glucose/galactose transporter [Mucilaginibacter phyllosphaerae]TEW67763.1 glucose/galactose MFS transporter [Mucilaginibacter phyllosphaerae]GGH15016.1 glucose/galactose MFS transporter [Mucilaginibacter phyllosphaerae]
MAASATIPQSKSTLGPTLIIGVLFFIFGFVTWLNSVLIPYLKIACELNTFQSYFVTSAFYIAYLLMAKPSAWLLNIFGFKNGMSVGLILIAAGALLFIPAALTRTYGVFLIGLFVQGSGLAVLQSASNPYITILGPPESAAKRISIMGIFNKCAGVLAPLALGAVVLKDIDGFTEKLTSLNAAQKIAELNELAARVILPYVIIVVVLVILAVLIYFSGLPEIDTDKEDEAVAAANSNKTSITQFPHLILGVVALFVYVGAEVIAGDSIIGYGGAHDIPLSTSKYFASGTLACMVIGYIAGILFIPKYISQQKALVYSAILGAVLTIIALFTPKYVSIACIALLGLANSLMWPALWPLALAGLGRFTKIGSSLLVMGIAGAAVFPPIYGLLVDMTKKTAGLAEASQISYWILVPIYLFILYYALAGYKAGKAVVVNKTITV